MQKAWEQLPWWPTALTGRIPSDAGHGRARGVGQKKEDDEGIRFHTLLTAGMHRGGRILPKKRVAAVLFVAVPGRRHFCFWRQHWASRAVQEEAARGKGAAQG
jgi:hypothetical protein